MTPEIAILLAQDGITTGAIYVLVALGTVLVFLVTRVIFIPFGDIVGYAALTLAALQLKQLPGTVRLVLTLAVIATAMDLYQARRAGKVLPAPTSVLIHLGMPIVAAALIWGTSGAELPMWAQIALTLLIVLPISPLLYRIAFQPLADASILVLLMIAVGVHFAMSGLALLYFGPEGFRTQPLAQWSIELGPVLISGQSLLMLLGSALLSLLLYLFFEHTFSGKALRATAVNRLGARLVGIPPGSTGTVAFLLASALAGVSGILIGPITTLYYDSGFLIGLKAFVGAIIGGLVSYPLAAAGAILVGLMESYAAFFSSAFKEVIVFGALIPILIWQSFISGSDLEEEPEEEQGAAQ